MMMSMARFVPFFSLSYRRFHLHFIFCCRVAVPTLLARCSRNAITVLMPTTMVVRLNPMVASIISPIPTDGAKVKALQYIAYNYPYSWVCCFLTSYIINHGQICVCLLLNMLHIYAASK
jgi:hypothetical protein